MAVKVAKGIVLMVMEDIIRRKERIRHKVELPAPSKSASLTTS